MKSPNPYPASRLSPLERRAELCRILALGLVRLRLRQSSEQSAPSGDSSLHFPFGWSGGVGVDTTGEFA